jgi:hypothetical protein
VEPAGGCWEQQFGAHPVGAQQFGAPQVEPPQSFVGSLPPPPIEMEIGPRMPRSSSVDSNAFTMAPKDAELMVCAKPSNR